ncbi:MAG: M23 family metallopeptidase [bacterium]|nr:M23 family metallopeptidase [bacterium]
MNKMKRLVGLISIFFAFTGTMFTETLDIRFQPDEHVYVSETNARYNYYDVMIHNIAVINKNNEPVELESARLDVIKNNKILQTIFISKEELLKAAQTIALYKEKGLLKLYDFYFQTRRLLGENVKTAPNLQLGKNMAIISSRHYFSLKGVPDYIRVTAAAKSAAGVTVKGEAQLKTVVYRQKNEYLFPVTGRWWVASASSTHSHHRWVSNQEFALDLGQLGKDMLTYRGKRNKSSDFYCFGKDIVAVADGTVVKVLTGLKDNDDFFQRENESDADFRKRSLVNQQKYVDMGLEYAGGNSIVIEHKGGEYSYYGHLKHGTIKLKKGDNVSQGQLIGQVGHSGNSDEPHLHFQFCDGADPFYSRGLPIKYKNAHALANDFGNLYLKHGDVVTAKPQ